MNLEASQLDLQDGDHCLMVSCRGSVREDNQPILEKKKKKTKEEKEITKITIIIR